MPSGRGPCRFGQYHRFHRMVLDEHGFENVPIYAPNQDDKLYQELDIVGGKFSRLGWRAIVATDLLVKMLHRQDRTRKCPGRRTRCTRRCSLAVAKAIESGRNGVFEALEQAVKAFLPSRRQDGKSRSWASWGRSTYGQTGSATMTW